MNRVLVILSAPNYVYVLGVIVNVLFVTYRFSKKAKSLLYYRNRNEIELQPNLRFDFRPAHRGIFRVLPICPSLPLHSTDMKLIREYTCVRWLPTPKTCGCTEINWKSVWYARSNRTHLIYPGTLIFKFICWMLPLRRGDAVTPAPPSPNIVPASKGCV